MYRATNPKWLARAKQPDYQGFQMNRNTFVIGGPTSKLLRNEILDAVDQRWTKTKTLEPPCTFIFLARDIIIIVCRTSI